MTGVPPVRIDVLGPLQLIVGGEPVTVPGPKRRAVLAILALAECRTVAVDDLLDALWGSEIPETARATLQSHVSRLRRHLGPGSARLEGLGGGYRLLLDAPSESSGTDVLHVRDLLARAEGPAAAESRRLLRDARALWRGEPLAEFGHVEPLSAWAVTLAELRRNVVAASVAAALGDGAIGEAVEIAAGMAATDPLSEQAVALHMRALDAAGRASDALRLGSDYRRRLSAEAGLDPSPGLDELERGIAAGGRGRAVGAAPRPAGRMHGREAEFTALQRLLADERLVTVLGPGGIGKSRLAAEVVVRAERATVLPLAAVTDVDALEDALAAALNLRVTHGEVLPACAALLGAGPQLLQVDNCEHLLPGVRQLVASLLDSCPELTVLATSREPLGLMTEQWLRLAPLPVTRPAPGEDLRRTPAVAVFFDRARRVSPGFSPSAADIDIIADIVRRLDGVPLAIELAAGRTASLGLRDIHARLDHALDLLGDGRNVTMRQTVEWSYDLLPKHEQRLFRHLGVFPDGFGLDTAELVAADLGPVGEAIGAVAHLVDASMVEVDFGDRVRYRMLDPIRMFARDQLERTGELDAAADRFVTWAVDLAALLRRQAATDDEPRADAALRRELANLRAAWRAARRAGRLGEAVRMIVPLAELAGWRDLTEIWSWSIELATDPAVHRHPDAALALGAAANSAWSRGELDLAATLARRGLERGGPGVPGCRTALALAALSRGELSSAAKLAVEAAKDGPPTDPNLGVAALATAYAGDVDAARALHEQMVAAAASPTIKGFASYVAGEVAARTGRVDEAERHYRQAIVLSRGSGATFVEGVASVGLLSVHVVAGRVPDALGGYRELIDYWDRTGGWIQQWATLRNLARLLRSFGDDAAAELIESAAERAPDAPAVVDDQGHALPAARPPQRRQPGDGGDRARVLDVARAAIARHLTRLAAAAD